jgi:para-aminobenzoate synthetase component 1
VTPLPDSIAKWVLPKEQFFERMNALGAASVPFLFVVDYAGLQPFAIPLDQVDRNRLRWTFGNQATPAPTGSVAFEKWPESFVDYSAKFERVQYHLHRGDSYLVNLTCRTPIAIDRELRELYELVGAQYKLLIGNDVLVFSPECFVRIENDRICSYPMKGTIDGSLPHAEESVLADDKETAEHYTIVDLIRNDLSQVARRVQVDSFRHVSRIRTNQKELLQVSSTISGELPKDWRTQLGDIFRVLLPAGSVTGAPKAKTCEIINAVEGYERGYYTGVYGVFDGTSVDSGVLIRFIEREASGQLVFKSGGGITVNSDARSEYQEMIDKVYVPLL